MTQCRFPSTPSKPRQSGARSPTLSTALYLPAKAEVASGVKAYNFGTTAPHGEENPGLSFFYQDPSGALFHSYSTYGRGLEPLLGTYAILDRAPKGRDEGDAFQTWIRRHDEYV